MVPGSPNERTKTLHLLNLHHVQFHRPQSSPNSVCLSVRLSQMLISWFFLNDELTLWLFCFILKAAQEDLHLMYSSYEFLWATSFRRRIGKGEAIPLQKQSCLWLCSSGALLAADCVPFWFLLHTYAPSYLGMSLANGDPAIRNSGIWNTKKSHALWLVSRFIYLFKIYLSHFSRLKGLKIMWVQAWSLAIVTQKRGQCVIIVHTRSIRSFCSIFAV